MNEQDARRLSLDIMESAETAILTTHGEDGYPAARAMLNLRNPNEFPGLVETFAGHRDDFLVYFTTNTSSVKMREIARNSAASVYYCLPGEYRGVRLAGRIEVVEDLAEKRAIWQPGWEIYYPGGVADPDNTLLRLAPEYGKLYHQLEHCTFSIRQS